MAAPTIQQVMIGIKNQLATITGLRISEYMADQVNPPHALVDFPNPIDYHATAKHGMQRFDPTVTLLVSATIDRVGMAALATYVCATGANSIHLAIEADSTLGCVFYVCFVSSFLGFSARE